MVSALPYYIRDRQLPCLRVPELDLNHKQIRIRNFDFETVKELSSHRAAFSSLVVTVMGFKCDCVFRISVCHCRFS